MGKLSDALRRAEEERRRRRAQGLSSPPALGAAKVRTDNPQATATNPGPAAPPEAPPETAAAAPPAPAAAPSRPRLTQPAPVPVPLTGRRAPRRPDPHLICFYDPHDGVAEKFREMRTNLLALERDRRPPHLIIVTSAAAGEGKTLICANLAVAMADYVAGPVLVADGDFRQPRLHEVFGLPRAPGFTDVLAGQVALSDALAEACVANLHVLTAGRDVDNPTALLGADQTRALLPELRQAFKYIIIDTPPVYSLTDASVLGAQADGALVVIRAGRTSREAVARGMDMLSSAGVRVLGTVLNGIRQAMPGYIYRRA